jgi:flagellar biosynthesis/type III secretory pathway protein FliH
LGFDDIPGGDIGYLPMSLLPAGMALPEGGDKARQNKAWNLSDENQKTAYWKAFDRRRQNWEKKVAQIVGRRFRDEGQKVAEAYEEGRDVDGVVDGQRPEWVTMMTAIYAGVMEDFGQETGEALAKSIEPTSRKFEFDPWLGEVRNWIENVVAEKVTQITDTTKKEIKQQIQEGFEEGDSTVEIARRIRKQYEDFTFRRAMLIARTEVVAASNAGSHFAAEQTGLDYERVWLSSRDERVRDDHADMDGQRRGKNEPFEAPDGSLLMFPGDTSLGAAASQTVMCRCTEIYEVRR